MSTTTTRMITEKYGSRLRVLNLSTQCTFVLTVSLFGVILMIKSMLPYFQNYSNLTFISRLWRFWVEA